MLGAPQPIKAIDATAVTSKFRIVISRLVATITSASIEKFQPWEASLDHLEKSERLGQI